MSHSPERKEKDCLNCGAFVHGRFCHVCGQENRLPRESFWSLVVHFFYDLTHFDSSFFDTVKYLLIRPGFLPKEYMAGRRASYLNPIRMYIFTSAFFFLIFFAFINPESAIFTGSDEVISRSQRDTIIARIDREILAKTATPERKKLREFLQDSMRVVTRNDLIRYSDDFTVINIGSKSYKSLKEYDSIQQQLPPTEKDNWLKRTWNRKELEINDKYRSDPGSSMDKLSDVFMHKLPYMLFISLPFFAMILKLLYVRRSWYYVDHLIFSVYHYIFSFIIMLFLFGFDALGDWTGYGIFDFLIFLTILTWIFYLYKSMRRFYGQRRFKTFIKFLLLNIMGFVCILALMTLFFLFSVFQI